MSIVKMEFECEKCGEFCYKDMEKGESWYVPKCRSCFNRMTIIKVIE